MLLDLAARNPEPCPQNQDRAQNLFLEDFENRGKPVRTGEREFRHMPIMQRLRAYHACLVILVVASYVSGEWGIVHAWLGYGVAVLILFRLLMSLTGAPQLGLMRFYPHFQGLRLGNAFTHPAISRTLLLGIAFSLLAVVATGIALDKGRALGVAGSGIVAPAYADDRSERRDGERGDGERGDGVLEELHEFFANLLMLVVATHVVYLLLFKRPLAMFMLFADSSNRSPRR